jgi:hypothetical protein
VSGTIKRLVALCVVILAACSGNTAKSSGPGGGERDSGSDALNEAGLPRCPVVVPVGSCTQLGLRCWAESFSECTDCTFTCTSNGWDRQCKTCGYGPCGIGGCQQPDGGCAPCALPMDAGGG